MAKKRKSIAVEHVRPALTREELQNRTRAAAKALYAILRPYAGAADKGATAPADKP